MRKKLVFILIYKIYKLFNNPSLTDFDSAKKSSLDSQTDIYKNDSIGEIKKYLALGDEDKKLRDAWPGIQREDAA